MSTGRFLYRREPITVTHHIITVHAHWRQIPRVLDAVRAIPLDIKRAQIHPDCSTFFMQEVEPTTSLLYTTQRLIEIGQDMELLLQEEDPHADTRIRLPIDTHVMCYNIPDTSCTTMEFSCKDRVGILSDLLHFMSSLDVDVHDAFISTVHGTVHNVFHVTKDGGQLSLSMMTYLQNVFEYEAKQRLGGRGHDLM
jgi:UTP:GlnB (protein PII) uridylyltransferase